jgi:hypothetical protein
MRLLFVVLLGGVICSLAAGRATAMPSSDLLRSCQAVIGSVDANERPQNPQVEIEIPEAGLPCWYYMSAVQNMAVLVDESGARLLGICAPADTTLLDFVRIVVKSARVRNSEDSNAAANILPALVHAFPCPSVSPTKRSITPQFR